MRTLADRTFIVLTLVATLVILTMIGIIVGNIVVHGRDRLSWEFLTAPPRSGMMEGGIFPAIY